MKIKKTMGHPAQRGGVCYSPSFLGCSRNNPSLKGGVFAKFLDIKRGQVTTFIIIAVIILVGVGIFFVFRNQTSELNGVDIEIKPVHGFVQDCIKQTGEDAVYYVSGTGGYVIVPDESLRIEFEEGFDKRIAYYLYEGENYMPSKEKIEEEISLYVDNMLAFCIADFSSFPEFEVESGEIKTKTKIEKGKVVLDVEYDLSVSNGEQVYELNDFKNNVVLVRLNKVYDVISEIMEKQMEKKDSVCISCLDEIGNKYDMKIRMSEGSGGIVFAIIDDKSQIYKRNYEFYFANKYGVEES